MFLHPADYGRKAEELLWRKVYYEVIQVIKTNKKVNAPAAPANLKECQFYILRWHLDHLLKVNYNIFHFGCNISHGLASM